MKYIHRYIFGSARGKMVTAIRNGHGDPSSIPGRVFISPIVNILKKGMKYESNYSLSPAMSKIVGQTCFGMANGLKGKPFWSKLLNTT